MGPRHLNLLDLLELGLDMEDAPMPIIVIWNKTCNLRGFLNSSSAQLFIKKSKCDTTPTIFPSYTKVI